MPYVSHSVEETQQLARAISERVQPGDVILLVGDLGAGKTHFTQGFAAGLGIAEVPTSPHVQFGVRIPRWPLAAVSL